MNIKDYQKRVWAEIDLHAVETNYNLIKKHLNIDTQICCVIKANAYGHGAVEMAKFYSKLGVEYFAVSNVEEALQLRREGIDAEILVLGYTNPKCSKILADNNVIQCVYSLEYAKLLSTQAQKDNVKVKTHIKIDTGMGRIGFRCVNNKENELDQALCACQLQNLLVEGVFTHFAVADEGEKGRVYTNKQIENFNFAINFLENKGVKFKLKHCSNSGAICDYSHVNMDMVRAGIVLYGLQPSCDIINKYQLKPVMTLKTVVSHVKKINIGDSVNYGRAFIAEKQMTVATLPIGYADGLWRGNSGKIKLTINGTKVDILGRICMDQLVVDVSCIEDIKIGDEVVVFGAEPYTTAQEIATINNTISYEVVCAIGYRVPRIYVYNGQALSVNDNLLKQ